jgi:hypothetical protein
LQTTLAEQPVGHGLNDQSCRSSYAVQNSIIPQGS